MVRMIKYKKGRQGVIEALDALEIEKGISKKQVLDALKDALETSYKKNYLGPDAIVKCRIDANTGVIELFEIRNVVDDVFDEDYEISLEEAQAINPDYKVGDRVINSVSPTVFGRLAAIQTRRIFHQKIREAENELIFNEYIDKKGHMFNGIVDRIALNFAIVNIGTAEAILPKRMQIPREKIKEGDHLKVYLESVEHRTKGTHLQVSRTARELVACLFEVEVPEIYNETITIKNVSRRAGIRSKMAVMSEYRDVDPIGTCVGYRGSRVSAVRKELNGEKIDIIPWDERPEVYIANALKPAKVVKVVLRWSEARAIVVVPDDQESLAIGRGGQNVALAAYLTNWRLDIKTESQVIAEKIDLTPEARPEPVKPEPVREKPLLKAKPVIEEPVSQEAEPISSEPLPDIETAVEKPVSKGKAKKRKEVEHTKKQEREFVLPEKEEKKEEAPLLNGGIVEYRDHLTVSELAEKMGKTSSDVIKVLFMLGNMVTINSTLSDEQIELVALEYGYDVNKIEESNDREAEEEVTDDPKDLVPRAPVVTIMGHVDHGKTTLLDYIRNSHITAHEFGGITQHIGAYQVKVNNKLITFLDTPGHEAFTAMRARGASLTDIVIIVVAADDGVMPQTLEAVDHAKAADVPIIVAVNKIDKPGANPERVKSEMTDLGLMPEEWGGDVPYVNISARTGEGVEELLETITIVAEMQELKANPKRLAYGHVIEAKLDKGRGPVASLLITNGTLHQGDPIVVGSTYGRVRQMLNDQGKPIKKALPATPVSISGLNEVPDAGDRFKVYESEKEARHIGEQLAEKKAEEERNISSAMTLDDLFNQIKDGEVADLNVVVKADVNGTAEAVRSSLEKINIEGARVHIIRCDVGAISEGDVILASASNAIIYGFNVRPDANVRKKANEEKVEIRLHNVIYKMVEEIEAAMKGLLKPEYEEVVTGSAEVRQIYKASKIGTIAGCYVIEGAITRGSGVRLIRNGIVVYEGKLNSLKRFKDDVAEVKEGYECGMTIQNFNDIKEGDIIEGYIMQEVPGY